MTKMDWERRTEGRNPIWACGQYRIEKWYANDRGNQVPQFAATVNGQPLNREPYQRLSHAKRVCHDHKLLMEARSKAEEEE